VDVNISVLDNLAIVIWPEDVADFSSICKWSIWNGDVKSISAVGESDEEITSGKSIEVVEHVLLLERMIPDLMSFSSLVDSGSHFIDI